MRLPTPSELAGQRLRFWRQPWFLTVLAIHAAAAAIYFQETSIDQWRPTLYALGLVSSGSFWLLVNLLRDELPRLGRYVLAVVVATLVSVIISVNYALFVEFGEFFSGHLFLFLVSSSGAETLRYAAGYFVYPYNFVFAGAIGAGTAIWVLGEAIPFADSVSRRDWAGIAAVLFVVTTGITSANAPRTQLPPDVATFTALARGMVTSTGHHYEPPNRQSVPSLEDESKAEPPNVLFVVIESWGKQSLGLYDAETDAMPYLKRWHEREPDRFVVFDRAYANSTATELSVPSMLTGVGPWEGRRKVHEMPTAWDWAQAAGLHPFFVSTQNYDFRGLHEFFFADAAFPHRTLGRFDELPRNKRYRVDEIQIAPMVLEMVDRVPEQEPFFGVYNPNALHEPAQQTSPELEEQPDFESDYQNALYILDRALERIFEGLRERGRLDNTLVILTADHGSGLQRAHLPPRITSFYEEFTNIPMAVRLPPGWEPAGAGSEAGLRENAPRNVANLDLVPTLAAAFGGDSTELYGQLRGHSLLRPVPADRKIIVLNTNSVRRWEHEGFGVFWQDWRFVFSDIEGAGLYDIGDDPGQTDDRWYRAPKPVRQRAIETIESNRHLERIWRSYPADPKKWRVFN